MRSLDEGPVYFHLIRSQKAELADEQELLIDGHLQKKKNFDFEMHQKVKQLF